MVLRWFGRGWYGAIKALAVVTVGVAFAVVASSDTAEARRRHGSNTHYAKKAYAKKNYRITRRAAHYRVPAYNPRFSSIVLDVKSGRILTGVDPDGPRHPASVTKVMTLYMLFEQLEARRLTLDSPLPVSARAAAQAPTKLGLRAGETIRVEDAIKGIVTRSANDAAVVVAEAIGGTEDRFAQLMTQKARSLGMNRTVYRNASGLPNPQQITTARDLARLGLAIQDRFPRYYPFFSMRTFVYRGRGIANHNRLLGQVEGVDGIKTGYTRASGFNLLTSVKRDGRQLVAVVLGGRSGSSRDETMRQMIADSLPRAYAGERQTPVYAAMVSLEHKMNAGSPAQNISPPPNVRPAVIAEARSPLLSPQPLVPAPALVQMPTPSPIKRSVAGAARSVDASAAPGPDLRWIAGAEPALTAPNDSAAHARPVRTHKITMLSPDATASVQGQNQTAPVRVDANAETTAGGDGALPDEAAAKATPTAPASQPARKGWIIQIGAPESESQALALLAKAQSTGHRAIAAAKPFTEQTEKNGVILWRARFAGFQDARGAENACAALKTRAFACITARL